MSAPQHGGLTSESKDDNGRLFAEFYCFDCGLRITGPTRIEVERLAESHCHHVADVAGSSADQGEK